MLVETIGACDLSFIGARNPIARRTVSASFSVMNLLRGLIEGLSLAGL
jgi:hypothetical protein